MKKSNPFKERIDLTTQLKFPTLSWSSMNVFESYDKEEWYQRYYLGKKGEINPAMAAGICIGERLAIDPTYLPEVPKYPIYEHSITVKFGNITLTCHIDGYDPDVPEIGEYKTTQNKKRWTKESVKDWGQLSFYSLCLFLHDDINPRDLKMSLTSIPVIMNGDFKVERSNDPIQIIPTSRTMLEILQFGVRIKKVYKEMELFIKNHEIHWKSKIK